MPLATRLIVILVVVVPLLMIASGVTIAVMLATSPGRFIDEPKPDDTAEEFLQALARNDLPAARSLLSSKERELERPLGLLGWGVADVLSDVCPDSLALELSTREETDGAGLVHAKVHYKACASYIEGEPEQDGVLDLRLIKESVAAFEGVELPFVPETPRWRIELGFAAYLEGLRQRPPPSKEDDAPVALSGLKVVDSNEHSMLVSAELENRGTATLSEVVTETSCDGDTTGWRIELRPVDPLAGTITTLTGGSLAEPLGAGEKRTFWGRLPDPPAGCEKLTMQLVGLVTADAPSIPTAGQAHASGPVCGKRLRDAANLILPSGERVELGAPCILGTARDAGVVLQDPAAARRHALIGRRRDGYFIRPLGTTGAIRVNGTTIVAETLLVDGAALQLGETTLRFEAAPVANP